MSFNARLLALHHYLLPPKFRLGWLPYLWLIYLGFFFIKYFFLRPNLSEVCAVIITMGLFLATYFSVYRRHGLGALLHIAVLTMLAILWAPFNPGSSVLFIYAASFAYLVGPPKKSTAVVFVIAVLAALTAWLAKPLLVFWLPAAAISVIIGVANIAFGEDDRKNAELRLNQAEIKRLAEVAERERIARDLHDVIGHTLSMIVVKSALALRLLEQDTAQAHAEIRSIEDTARNSLQEVRKAISGLHQQSLTEALDQAALAMGSANVELQVNVDDRLQLPVRDAAMLGLVIREACTNVIRHANAQVCRISLQHDTRMGRLLLDISDDGGGHIRPEGSGIQGMRARLESLGGELQLDPKRGGHLHGWVPLA